MERRETCPIQCYMFASLVPHWIIPAATLLSMDGDTLLISQLVDVTAGVLPLTDDAKHLLKSLTGVAIGFIIQSFSL